MAESTHMNRIGKFEMLQVINEFDAALIRLFGINMRDAAVSRWDALNLYSEVNSAQKAAEICGQRLGLSRA